MPLSDGQLGLDLFDDRFVQDPYPLYERMLAAGPVHPIGDSGFYAVCTWDAINEVITRPEDFSSNLTATMTYQDGNVGTFPWAKSAETFKRLRLPMTPLMPHTGSCWCRN